jgi:maltose alpha-D-glucosyltransferase/alpha-amylase
MPAPEPMEEFVTIVLRDHLAGAVTSSAKRMIEGDVLPPYVAKRRWFGLKDETIKSARIASVLKLADRGRDILLSEIEITTSGGNTTRWQLPLSILWENEVSAALPQRLALARVRKGRHLGFLTDAFALPDFARKYTACLAESCTFENAEGTVCFRPTDAGQRALATLPEGDINWLAAEQSNSSLIVADAVMLKIYRRISPGIHPEPEMGRYLTEKGFANTPPLLGDVIRLAPDKTQSTLAIALGFVRNQGDAWSWTVDRIARATENMAPANDTEAELLADCDAMIATIGRRLGEMHAILAQPASDETFAPEVANAKNAKLWAQKTQERIDKAFDALDGHGSWERDQDRERAEKLLASRESVTATIRTLAKSGAGALMTRIHGDFHLGQILVADADAYIIDFEGEPATPLAERRAKTSPLRDVAGLLRSIHYAGATMLDRNNVATAPVNEELRSQIIGHFRQRASRAFLRGYWHATCIEKTTEANALLDLFLIEKAAYEISYEAANRPTWIGVPLAGLSSLLTRITDKAARVRHE